MKGSQQLYFISAQFNMKGSQQLYSISAQFDMKGSQRRSGSRCVYDFISSSTFKSGQFYSPMYPQNYPAKSDCQYAFEAFSDERVIITFNTIQLGITSKR